MVLKMSNIGSSCKKEKPCGNKALVYSIFLSFSKLCFSITPEYALYGIKFPVRRNIPAALPVFDHTMRILRCQLFKRSFFQDFHIVIGGVLRIKCWVGRPSFFLLLLLLMCESIYNSDYQTRYSGYEVFH